MASRFPRHQSLLAALYETRKNIDDFDGDEVYTARLVVQLTSIAQCIDRLARSGYLHVDVDVGRVQSVTYLARGRWTVDTLLLDAPVGETTTLPPELSAWIMQAIVVLGVVARDPDGVLVEFRSLAGTLVDETPPTPSEFERELRSCWRKRFDVAASPSRSPLAMRLSERLLGLCGACCVSIDPCETTDALDYARIVLLTLA